MRKDLKPPLPWKRSAAIIAALLGAGMGLYLLLFAMSNRKWVVIEIPNAPWHSIPSQPAWEAQLWWIMFIAFIAGAILVAIASILVRIGERRRIFEQKARIEQLEAELKALNRLLAATRNQSTIPSPAKRTEGESSKLSGADQ